ncbi:OmpA family protein [Bacteroidales bacterium OttesenSCG-928-B11]|nr:OmpA family protein [Bacteroidales bacterium OttesenSCG-928-E04]MDL2308977.1 OmpA family protein [Bacteroidales bacterium OttesenSCG-928-C03]MDL2313201.1 OmpA family protein [Bacteroidales bacterium OttesenSCG-928-B11]MDL2326856.1 OmpA family protein [Bacteroidales bacterium OttesenSCG-928-A14]
MNKIKITAILICALIVSISITNAQTTRDADNAFRHCQYEKALDEYRKGVKKIKKNRVELRRVTFQIAECYRIMGDLKRAEQQYLRLHKQNYQKDNPIILFHLGSIYNLRGEYDQALKYYTDYKKRVPEDTRIDARVEGCQKAKQWVDNPTRYEVENFKKLNTKQDEWAPRWGNLDKKNQIIFSSNREGSVGKGQDQWTGGYFADLYRTDKPKSKNTEWPGEWSPTLPLDEGDVLNTAVNEGEASANLKGGVIYFTRCPQDKKKVMQCYVYSAQKRGKSWSEPAIVELGPDSFNYVHPYIMPDELTLYFASNKPDGYGGYDLYKATRTKKSGKFTTIENLGPNVNTSGQEVFPTMKDENNLYFSSDGWPGMGGLDLFHSEFKDGEFQPAVNLMYPINSCWDDMSIIFDDVEAIDPLSKSPYMDKGYFSSNRPGGRGGDDIYYFVLRPLVYSISGFVRDEATLQYIDGATVEISGSDGSLYTTKTDVKGYYHFDKSKILGNVTYTMKVTREKYWEDQGKNTATQTTVGLAENTDLKQDFILVPIPNEPIILPEVLYDFDQSVLKSQYKDSLLFLYNIMIKNPTLVVELRSHTDYKGNDEYNEKLSQRRAESCVNFLINEKGIDPDRIVARGYGEYRPRKFLNDFSGVYRGKRYTFPKGTELTEAYITSLSDKDQQEYANQLNRRTEFIVLRSDFVPKGDQIGDVKRTGGPIAVVNENSTPVEILDDGTVKGTAVTYNKSYDFVLATGSSEVYISYILATQYLKEMTITVDNFEEGAAAIKQEDGSIIENSVIYITELRIGDEWAENVPVIVKKGLPATFVIGEDFIKEEIDNFRIDKDRKLLIYDTKR